MFRGPARLRPSTWRAGRARAVKARADQNGDLRFLYPFDVLQALGVEDLHLAGAVGAMEEDLLSDVVAFAELPDR